MPDMKSPPNFLDRMVSTLRQYARPVNRGLEKQIRRSNAGASNPRMKSAPSRKSSNKRIKVNKK